MGGTDGTHEGLELMKQSKYPGHGGRDPSPTYNTWRGMIQRCTNPKHTHFNKYKGLLCEEWKDFNIFLMDMGERPEGMTLDRIDNSLGYYKANCRWASPEVQIRNRDYNVLDESVARRVRELSEQGIKPKEISEMMGLSKSSVSNVLHKGYWK